MAKSIRECLEDVPIEEIAFNNLPAYTSLQDSNYRFAPHNLLLMDTLMRVEAGEINRLIVAAPPRHGKTSVIGELFPAWYLGRNPSHQIIYSTYAYERAGDVGRKVRNQMLDRAYQRIFKQSPLAMDSRGVNKLSTDQGGNLFSVGVGGILTGRGANVLLIDDPHKGRKEVESDAQRNRVIEWFQSVAYTRLMPGGKIVVLATRWHFSDLSGFILEELKHEKWHYLRLPAVCDSTDDILGRGIGDPLWPSDYPNETLENIRETVGTREWNAQYQQVPLPASGGMVQLDWFSHYDWGPWAAMEFVLKSNPTAHISRENIPYGIRRIVISIDTAFKEEEINDPSAFTVWGITADYRFYLLAIVNDRFNYPKLKKQTLAIWEKYSRVMTGLPIVLLIEDKGSGQSLIQDLKNGTTIPTVAIPATVSKQIRMSSASPLIESGKVFLPTRAPWVVAYETQMGRFPLWKEDDLVDSTSQFLNWVSQPQYVKTGKKFWK
jgi:predicted phage terminase large subunit-like protein